MLQGAPPEESAMTSPTRTERDSFGTIEVPADVLWGAQTARSLQHFAISTERMPADLLKALDRKSTRLNSSH